MELNRAALGARLGALEREQCKILHALRAQVNANSEVLKFLSKINNEMKEMRNLVKRIEESSK